MRDLGQMLPDEPCGHARPRRHLVESQPTLHFRLSAAALCGCTGARIMSGCLINAHGAATGAGFHATSLRFNIRARLSKEADPHRGQHSP